MSKIIPFNLPVSPIFKDYLADVYLPEGCEIGKPIWRTDAWGTHKNMPETFAFLKSGIKPKSNPSPTEILPEPWFSTAQVLVIWLHRNQNLKAGRIAGILSAFKTFHCFIALENNFCQKTEDLRSKHFIQFEDHLRKRIKMNDLTEGGARLIALGLEKFVKFLNHFEVCSTKIVYKQSFKRPTSSHEFKIVTKDSTEATARNQIIHKTKLLEIDILYALGNLFNNCNDPVDRFFLATTLLLSVTGFRVSELLSLKEDCYHEYLHEDKKLVEIRYVAEKSGSVLAKQIPEKAVDFIKKCLEVIYEFTKEGRKLAKRLEKDKSLFPLNSHIRNRETAKISEIAEFLKIQPITIQRIVKDSRIKPINNRGYYITEDLIDVLNDFYLTPKTARPINYEPIVRKLNDGTCIKLSEALFVTKAFEVSSRKVIDFLPKNLSLETYDKWLDTVCEKYNIQDSAGEKIKIRSHQFRHLLNTLYVKGGLTEEEIGRIFGRKDLKQNRAYNQLSPREKRLQICDEIRENKSIGVITDTYHQIKLISPEKAEEFLESVIEAVHITEFGLCVLDWARQPCPHHMTCLSGRDGIACRNLVIIKGNKESLVQIEKHYKFQVQSLAKAQESESPFSQDWIDQTIAKIRNMEVIIQIHVDSLSDGTAGQPAFPFENGANPLSITRSKDLAEFQHFENR